MERAGFQELLAGSGAVADPGAPPRRVLGIDLGTTNSAASEGLWHGGSATVRCHEVAQETLQGVLTHVLVPSMVALLDGREYVGDGAKRLRARGLRPGQAIFSECKNDIGTSRTYHRAPQGYRTPAEIGGRVLRFLVGASGNESGAGFDRVVVTVPASFQAAQRADTVRAAELAGLRLSGGDLLDEPTAAFIDYLFTRGRELLGELDRPRVLVVFDFGGGTCDVAVLKVERGKGLDQPPLRASSLAVSRYYRLGGGDIDAAIVHEVLLPQLRQQNGLSTFDLSFSEKKHLIEPALLGAAEQLKIGLCDELRRLAAFDALDQQDKSAVYKVAPGTHECRIGDKVLELLSPRLTLAEFEDVLAPFLDQDLLYARESEYTMKCSIFAPLRDALDRAGIEPRQVDFCLAVGGSSLIPQVLDALDRYFPNGTTLSYPDRDSVKTCVSRGAAYHALALELRGTGIVQPVCADDISIRTASGRVRLIPKGAALPYPPSGGRSLCSALGVPEAVPEGRSSEIRVELVAGDEERKLLVETWKLQGPLRMGQPLELRYILDENQVLDLRLSLDGDPAARAFEQRVQNPLTNVVNPQVARIEAMEIEERLKEGGLSVQQNVDELTRLAELCAELGQREKAVEVIKSALQRKQQPDPSLLNQLGMLYGQIGDHDREEKCYRESAATAPWAAPLFNLALAFRRRGKGQDAIAALEAAMARNLQAPQLVLRALLAEDEHDLAGRQRFLDQALARFGPVNALGQWELGWLCTAAERACDQTLLESARQAMQQRRLHGTGVEAGGKPPIEIDPRPGSERERAR